MAIATGTAIAIAAAVTAAAAGGSAIAANQQRQDAKGAANKQFDEQKRLVDEANAKMSADKIAAEQAATLTSARKRQRALATGGQSRQDTILTGALGLPGKPETAGKVLLGA